MTNRGAIVLVAGVVVLAPAIATGQVFGGGPTPRNGACFYQDANFRGAYFCLSTDESLDSMPSGANDRISSIRVYGRAEVTVYEDPRFRGESLQFDSNVNNLDSRNFNDLISSIQVQPTGGGSGRFGRGGGSRPSFGGPNPDVIVRRAYQDILGRDPDQAGLRDYRSRIIDDGWTEQQVREDLRRSPEYREKTTMTRPKAEAIVRAAYLAVLGREPDPGSAGYVNNVLRDKWTQEDVERELRRSAEYRNRAPGARRR